MDDWSCKYKFVVFGGQVWMLQSIISGFKFLGWLSLCPICTSSGGGLLLTPQLTSGTSHQDGTPYYSVRLGRYAINSNQVYRVPNIVFIDKYGKLPCRSVRHSLPGCIPPCYRSMVPHPCWKHCLCKCIYSYNARIWWIKVFRSRACMFSISFNFTLLTLRNHLQDWDLSCNYSYYPA